VFRVLLNLVRHQQSPYAAILAIRLKLDLKGGVGIEPGAADEADGASIEPEFREILRQPHEFLCSYLSHLFTSSSELFF
jgi:hypothetical protein